MPTVQAPRKALRVLLVEPQSSHGNWHYTYQLAHALRRAGVAVGLATLAPFESLKDLSDVPLFTIGAQRNFESRHSGSIVSRFFYRFFHHVDKLRRLFTLVSRFRPDIVHLQGSIGTLDFLYFGLLRMLGRRVVYTAFEPKAFGSAMTWFDHARFRRADLVLVHSPNGTHDVMASGVDKAKIRQIVHGNFTRFCRVEGKSRSRAREEVGLPGNARAVLFFGVIARRKGLDLLIEAFSKLVADVPDAHLLVAGALYDDFSIYQRQIQSLGLADRVVLHLRYVPFEDFWKYFLAADVVALPYRHIYQSGVLQLAYGFGRPVVATDVGGVGPTVREDGTGIVVSPEPSAIAAALCRLLTDPQTAVAMGDRGRVLAETKYSWARVAESLLAIYQSVTSPSVALSFPAASDGETV